MTRWRAAAHWHTQRNKNTAWFETITRPTTSLATEEAAAEPRSHGATDPGGSGPNIQQSSIQIALGPWRLPVQWHLFELK